MTPRVGPYELLQELGRGSSAAVFLAQRQGLVRPVALKVLSRATDEEGRERFLREARVASALQHPAIIGCFDIGEDHENGWLYLALDYVGGESLAERLERGPLEIEEALDMGVRLADALNYAHTRGVLHRDLKPANILFDTQGNPKLTDFGLAAYDGDPRLTASDEALGTPLYMAPEQFLGRSVDRRNDVYSLGAVLYHALTGRAPYPGKTTAEVAGRVRAGGAPPPSHVRFEVSPAISEVVLKAMAREPENRFLDMASLGTALRSLQSQSSASGASAPAALVAATQGLPSLVWVGVAGLAFLGTVLVAILLGLTAGDPGPEALAERSAGSLPAPSDSPRAPTQPAPTTPSRPPSASPIPALPAPTRTPTPSPTRPPPSDPPPIAAPLPPLPGEGQGELSLDEASRAIEGWGFAQAETSLAEARRAGAAFDRVRTVEQRLAQAREEERRLRRSHLDLYEKQLRPADALSAVEQSLKDHPLSIELSTLRAYLLSAFGRFAEAADVYEELFRGQPSLRAGANQRNQQFMRQVAALVGGAGSGEAPWSEWIPLLGGHWRQEPAGVVRGSAVGLGDFGFAGLVHRAAGRLQPPYTISAELELDCSKPSAFGGVFFGLQSTNEFLLVYVFHQPEAFTLSAPGKTVEDVRKELGAWPKAIRCARMVGGRWQIIDQQMANFPDTGWVRLEVEVSPGGFLPRINGQAGRRVPVSDRLDGRVGILKFYDNVVGFRGFSAK